MGRPRVYERRQRIGITRAHDIAIRREIALTGESASEVMRKALDAYFSPVAVRRRRSS
jgi:hypothetical protein